MKNNKPIKATPVNIQSFLDTKTITRIILITKPIGTIYFITVFTSAPPNNTNPPIIKNGKSIPQLNIPSFL